MKSCVLLLCIIFPTFIFGNQEIFQEDAEERRINFIVDVINSNLNPNGWSNLLCVGHLPDLLYVKLLTLPLTFSIIQTEGDGYNIDDVVPYSSNVILISSKDFDDFEDGLKNAVASPYWHPHAHLIIYYHAKETEDLSKMFMVFWFYYACNAVIVQYDDVDKILLITQYNPYISENYRLANEFGCWKSTKVGRPMNNFRDGFVCVNGCHNVTLHSKIRRLHLATCIGFETREIRYGDLETLKKFDLFEDKSKDLHGVVLRVHGNKVLPFVGIDKHENGTYTLYGRDGMIWNLVSKLMNFKFDFSASEAVMFEPFNFETNIQLIFTFAKRQADILLFPIYQFDIIIVEIDLSIAYKDSGVCIMSHRAGFETLLFDVKLLQDNTEMVVKFLLCLVCIWLLFVIFNRAEKGVFSFDQLGKDFMNTIRNVLSLSLYNPPKEGSFRIFLVVSIWCFFIINFSTQAAITSFFSAYKRGKEVETFEDVVEKGFPVEGMASPDMMLPDTEERFRIINSRLTPVKNLVACVNHMVNDSRRFCLIDCSVGRYLERNRLNDDGEQFLHIAKDRIHSHYLNMVLHKHSPLTKTFNRYLRLFFEAGLIKKWEDYRFSDIKPEVHIKPLSMEDLIGIFKCYMLLQGLSFSVFILELISGFIKFLKRNCIKKIRQWKRSRLAKKIMKLERKARKIKLVNADTQTA